MFRINFLFAFTFFLVSNLSSTTYAKNPKLTSSGDTSLIITIKFEKKENLENKVELINNETPIIVHKGDKLVLEIEQTPDLVQNVRIHSSLGRLVKSFTEIREKLFFDTKQLEAGVYLIIIKREKSREIRKFLLTE